MTFRALFWWNSFPSFSLPDVPCDRTDLIWRKGTPFEVMTGCTAPSSDNLLAEVFLSCKVNIRSVHGPQYHFTILLIISDRCDWRDTQSKWTLTRNPDRNWWHRHTSLKLSWPQPMALWDNKQEVIGEIFVWIELNITLHIKGEKKNSYLPTWSKTYVF